MDGGQARTRQGRIAAPVAAALWISAIDPCVGYSLQLRAGP